MFDQARKENALPQKHGELVVNFLNSNLFSLDQKYTEYPNPHRLKKCHNSLPSRGNKTFRKKKKYPKDLSNQNGHTGPNPGPHTKRGNNFFGVRNIITVLNHVKISISRISQITDMIYRKPDAYLFSISETKRK